MPPPFSHRFSLLSDLGARYPANPLRKLAEELPHPNNFVPNLPAWASEGAAARPSQLTDRKRRVTNHDITGTK